MRRLITVVAPLLLMCATEARAFDYAAHCRMSNRGLRLAIAQATSTLGPLDTRRQELNDLAVYARDASCSPKDLGGTRAYGGWVAQVDWAVTPADFFLTPLPGEPNMRSDVAPTDVIRQLRNLHLQSFRVLHNNSEHFGPHALYSFRLWHQRALTLASEGRLGEALVYNAFADHYLEDLYAPGHIFSPRLGLNDALSGEIHNFYNKRGAFYFPINTTILASYVRVLPEMGDAAEPSFWQVLSGACGGAEPSKCVEALDGDSIPMFGDNQLSRSPRQELYVTLVVARSVNDLIAVWLSRHTEHASDSFRPAQWCGFSTPDAASARSQASANRPWISPTVVWPFGRFRQEMGSGLIQNDGWLSFRAGYAKRIQEPGGVFEFVREWTTSAQAANWLGATGPSRWTEDVSTYRDLEFRLPDDRRKSEWTIGTLTRKTGSLNRIDGRISYLYGGRIAPQDRSFEAHGGASLEVGFSVIYFEVRPSVAFNTRHAWEPAISTGLSLVLPQKADHVLRATLPPETPGATQVTCTRNTLAVP